MTVQQADTTVERLGAVADFDTAAANTTKADVLETWKVCTQDPAPGKPIGLDPAGAAFAFLELTAAPHC